MENEWEDVEWKKFIVKLFTHQVYLILVFSQQYWICLFYRRGKMRYNIYILSSILILCLLLLVGCVRSIEVGDFKCEYSGVGSEQDDCLELAQVVLEHDLILESEACEVNMYEG